jgi:hypothetical protein
MTMNFRSTITAAAMLAAHPAAAQPHRFEADPIVAVRENFVACEVLSQLQRVMENPRLLSKLHLSLNGSSLSAQKAAADPPMRINIWIILAALLALLVITRYMQNDRDTQRICTDDPSASVCQR